MPPKKEHKLKTVKIYTIIRTELTVTIVIAALMPARAAAEEKYSNFGATARHTLQQTMTKDA